MQRPNVTRLFGITVFGLTILLAAAAAQADYMDTVLAGNPLGYWRLDETTATTAANKGSTGTTGTGTYTNFADTDLGKSGALNGDINTAAGFDGVNNYLAIPEATVTSVGTGEFSVEMWFNASNSTRGDLFNYKNGDVDFGLFYESSKLNLWSTAVGSLATGSTELKTNQWYHMVLTRDGSSNVTAYINGVEQFSVGGSTENFGSVGHAIFIGVNYNGADLTFPVSGSIDEVAIYGSAMSQPTALAHYNAGITVPEPSTAILLGSALIGLLCYAWRKRR